MLKVKKKSTIHQIKQKIKLVNYKMTLKIIFKKYIQTIKKDKTVKKYANLNSEIRKEYNMLCKENQDLKTEMQNLRNY